MVTYSEMVHSSIRDILNVVFRHKWKISLFFLIVVTLVTVLAYLTPEIYCAEAKILIRSGRENLTVDLPERERTLTMVHDRESQESLVNSEIGILKSRYLIEKVVEQIGEEAILKGKYSGKERQGIPVHRLDRIRQLARWLKRTAKEALVAADLAAYLTPREKAITEMTRNLTVESVPSSNVVLARFESENRYLARDALDLLVSLYLDRHIEVNKAQASPEFFQGQALEKWKELVKSEEELDAFRKQHGIASIATQQEVTLLQIKDLENARDTADAMARASEARIAKLEAALEDHSPTIQLSKLTGRHNYVLDALKERLLELRIEETDLASRYVDTYLPLVEVRENIRRTEEMLGQEDETHTEVTMGVNVNYQALMLDLETERTQFEAHKAKRDVLAAEVENHREQLAYLASRQVELESLERARRMAEAEYSQYRENVHRAKISSELDKVKVSNASVVQPAMLPLKPVRPNKFLIIALGILFGILGGLGPAYLCEYFDDTFRTDADVEKWLHLPVLASVSEKEFRSCT